MCSQSGLWPLLRLYKFDIVALQLQMITASGPSHAPQLARGTCLGRQTLSPLGGPLLFWLHYGEIRSCEAPPNPPISVLGGNGFDLCRLLHSRSEHVGPGRRETGRGL